MDEAGSLSHFFFQLLYFAEVSDLFKKLDYKLLPRHVDKDDLSLDIFICKRGRRALSLRLLVS